MGLDDADGPQLEKHRQCRVELLPRRHWPGGLLLVRGFCQHFASLSSFLLALCREIGCYSWDVCAGVV